MTRDRAEYQRAWRAANRDKTRAAVKRCRLKHLERYRAEELARYHALPQEHRGARRLKRRYGLTPEQLIAMKADQNNACAICGVSDQQLHIDHCHESGRVRALLCASCNRGIGQLKDDPALLEAAAVYLRRFQPPEDSVMEWLIVFFLGMYIGYLIGVGVASRQARLTYERNQQ